MSEARLCLGFLDMALPGCFVRLYAAFYRNFSTYPRLGMYLVIGVLFSVFSLSPVLALEPILLKQHSEKGLGKASTDNRIDINQKGDFYLGKSKQIQVRTAADAEGISQRMVVGSKFGAAKPNWVVFALKNTTDQQMERWLVAKRYNIMGSGIFWPDLDRRRILAVTPSVGFRPEAVKSDQTDIFRLTVEPGATVTFVAELTKGRFPDLSLWKSSAFEEKRRDIVLFNGILLGITSLLALLLSVLFIANPRVLFPASALVAWSVLAYFCVDFGFWGKLFNLSAEHNAVYRGITEAAIPASLTIFLYLFLRISLWYKWVRYSFLLWIAALLCLVVFASFQPQIGSGLARLALLGTVGASGFLLLYLTFSGHGRAMSLMPTWLLFMVWLFAGMMAVNGVLQGDFIPPVLNAGLMLFLVLIGLLVTQFAFEHTEFLEGTPPGSLQKKIMALEAAKAHVWEWNIKKDRVTVGREIEENLGLAWGSIKKREQWLGYMHPSDRDKFSHLLSDIKQNEGGNICESFRMRRTDGSYLWFDLKAFSQEIGTRRTLRCIGLITNDTDTRRSSERLKNNSVLDNMTGLANRELFLDRLSTALVLTRENRDMPPTVIIIDIDRFKSINSSFGMGIGDTILLTVARRITDHLRPQDTLARVGGNQFAVKLNAQANQDEVMATTVGLQQSLKEPIIISGQHIALTTSIGITVYNGTQIDHEELFREAEIAMFHAKHGGTNRIEVFRNEMRDNEDNNLSLLNDLRLAIGSNELEIVYQPILRMSRDELVGFEALLRWHHPRLGVISPEEFIPLAEKNGLIHKIGLYVLESATTAVLGWNRLLKDPKKPVFVSVNVSSRQLFRGELVSDVSQILEGKKIPSSMLRLEITETIVMENPEEAGGILRELKALGVGLSMDDFGTGYSSLAYLLRFPFDTIKIDKELVSLEHDGKIILRSVVAMVHELGKFLVAEGVETVEEVNFLHSIECDYGQGFLYGEPMDNEAVMSFLGSFSIFTRKSLKVKLKEKKAQALQEASLVTGQGEHAGAVVQGHNTGTGQPLQPAAPNGDLALPVRYQQADNVDLASEVSPVNPLAST